MSKKAINVGSWNLCNGLLNKKDYVKNVLNEYQLDILFLQETEIPTDTEITLLSIGGYSCEVAEATTKSRVVAYIKININYTRVREQVDTNVILLQLDNKYITTQVIGLYRPFKITSGIGHIEQFKNQLQTITNFLNENESRLIVGDFNLDYDKKMSRIMCIEEFMMNCKKCVPPLI